MKATASFGLTLLALTSIVVITACGGGSTPAIVTRLTMSVSSSANAIAATQTASVTATITGDSSGKGVNWTVSCNVSQCGSISPSPTGSGVATTYTAPSTPPASDLSVTITATSAADATKSATTTVTVLAITLSVAISGNGITASTPTSATVQVGTTNGTSNFVDMNVNVSNDPSNTGVEFTTSPTVTLVKNPPFDAVFTAPTTAPASTLTVTVTITSVTDPTKTATVTITVSSIAVSLNQQNVDVDAQGTVGNIIATVVNDPSNKGVSWTVSCTPSPCGSVLPTKTLSGVATIYSAPSTPPSGEVTVTITASSVADPAAQASMTINFKAISVSISVPNDNTTVLFGQTQPNMVAVVQHDPANKGVTWAIQSCNNPDCGSIAPTASASGAAVTYAAPTAPPASDVAVNIVASSDSNPAQQGSITLTVPAITVNAKICTDQSCAVAASTGVIPVNAAANLNTTPIVANVNNDFNGKGVNWALTQGTSACSPSCGNITASTASGTPAAYVAPTTLPANVSVTATATSVTDGTKQSTVTITLAAGTVKLIPAKLDFGGLKLNRRSPHPMKTLAETVINTGGSALSITGQTISGGPFMLTAPCNGSITTSVASGMLCSISVRFAPTTLGQFNQTLTITDNDSSSPQQVPLSGKACSVTPCVETGAFREAIAQNQVATVPSPRGGNQVGTQTIDFVDANRMDPYLANGAKRELLVRFWYPTASKQACTLAQYTSSGVWNYLGQLEKVTPPQVTTNSCQDAPVAADKHPVIVFTHGYTGTFTDYTFLFEDLASRGYVVASINHTYEATAVQFPDGRLVKSLVGSRFGHTSALDDKSTSFAVAARLSDLKFVMDELRVLNTSSSAFKGKLDLSRVAVAGHSLGGMTALLGIEIEPRFRAAISIDGVVPGTLFSETDKPVMMLFSGRDPWDHDTCHLWGQLQGPRLAVNLKGSEHVTPSDAVWLAKGAVQAGTAGMETTVQTIRTYIAAFLDANLKGDSTHPFLDAASAELPDVEVTTQAQSPPCGSP